MLHVSAIRGATTVCADTKEEIIAKTAELFTKIYELNGLKNKRVISVIISTTNDIHSFYPARALRESGILSAPLFSCVEPEIDGALKLCIRAMVTVESESAEVVHVYLNGAKALRPDLSKN